MELNRRLVGLGESPTLEVADRVRKLEAAGKPVIKLQTGDPDFATPGPIVSAAADAIRRGMTHYSNTRGLPELRTAIAAKLGRQNSILVDPATELLITHGGVHAIFMALSAILNRGDEVLIPDPCWRPYVSSTVLAGGKPVAVSSRPEDGFKPQAADIRKAATGRTRALIINSPANPTGAVLNRSDLQEIASVAQDLNLWVIADEVYERLVYDGSSHVSIASLPGMRSRTVTVNSFSKTYAMTGWRLGYVTAHSALCQQMLKVSQYTVTNVSPFVQMAGLAALTDSSVESSVHDMLTRYAARREFVIDTLGTVDGLVFNRPAGAFYFMLDIRKLGLTSGDFSSRLLDQEFVAVVPGAGFGPSGEGHVRITFAASERDLEEGVRRIGRFVAGFRH